MKKNRLNKSAFLTALVLVIAINFSSCNKEPNVKPTIAQIAVTMKGFSQLEATAIRTDFLIALSNKNPESTSGGNYTVFIPTNQAFAKIGLVNSADLMLVQKSFLSTILQYHVNNGLKVESDFTNGTSLPSVLGATKRIIKRGNDFFVNGAKIIATNTYAENGIVHAIDKVLLASNTDITNTTKLLAEGKVFVTPELSILDAAINYCELGAELSKPNLTVFAPNNQAFKDLGKSLNISIENPSDIRKLDKNTLKQILLTHIIDNGGKFTSELYPGNIISLSTKQVTLGAYTDGVLTVKGVGNSVTANMVIPDIQATNGVIHIIDRVLLP